MKLLFDYRKNPEMISNVGYNNSRYATMSPIRMDMINNCSGVVGYAGWFNYYREDPSSKYCKSSIKYLVFSWL